jgi:hypothetical protein
MHGILKLRAMIQAKPDLDWRTRYGGRGTEEVVGDLDVSDVINVPGSGTGSGA